MVRQRFLWEGSEKSSRRQARVAPSAAYQGVPGSAGLVRAPVVDAVVVTVRVPVPAEAVVMFTGVVEPKLRVGKSLAPLGLDARAAVRATLPVKPPLGVTVMVAVLAVVAPGVTVMAPLLERAYDGGGT
jgi:hypothetical protein